MTEVSKDIRDRFDRLVDGLEGPVPKGVLANFLLGPVDPAVGMPTKPETPGAFYFSEREVSRVLDIAETNLKRIIDLPTPEDGPVLICCGGGPGSGKTTMMLMTLADATGVERLTATDWAESGLGKVLDQLFLAKDAAVPAAFSASDRKGLLQIARTIAAEGGGEPKIDEACYLHNRAASNFLSLFEMNAAFTHKKNLVWDTTLGSQGAISNLNFAKGKGYKIFPILQGAPLETREDAVNIRNAECFQSLKMNLMVQEEGFRNVMKDVIGYGDKVTLAWRDAADKPGREVAVLSPADKKILIIDPDGFDKFRALYPQIDELGFDTVSRPGSAAKQAPGRNLRNG